MTPSWAGDGQTIVALVGSASATGIALVDLADPEQARVKQVLWRKGDRLAVQPSYPVYSAETGRCVFVGKDENGAALYTVQPGQFDPPKRLEPSGYDGKIASLAFSPDGRYVLFCSDRLNQAQRRTSPGHTGLQSQGAGLGETDNLEASADRNARTLHRPPAAINQAADNSKQPPKREEQSQSSDNSADESDALEDFLDRIESGKPPPFGRKPKRHSRDAAGQITKLDLRELKLEKSDFPLIGTLKYLESLNLYDTNVSDENLQHLAGLGNLRELILNWTDITGKGLAHLKDLKRLEKLELRLTKIRDEDVPVIQGLTNLRRLKISDTAITDSSLKLLGELSELETLKLGDTNITDEGLRHLKGLKKLRGLTLNETAITEAGLTSLAELRNFEWIASTEETVREYIRRAERSDFEGIERMSAPGVYLPERGKFKLLKVETVPKNERDKRKGLQRYYMEMHWTVDQEKIDDVVHITFSVDRGTVRGHEVGIRQD